MSLHLQHDLAAIETSLSQQASAVEGMVQQAYRGLCERRSGVVEAITATEREVNELEVLIEEQCLKTLALNQPVAIDLRRAAAALKINTDLERIGDLAVNLAERNESLLEYPEVSVPPQLEQMVERVIEMLRDAHTAFVQLDETLAENIRIRDDEIDAANSEVIAGLIERMKAESANAPGYLHMFSATRIVERMGDHASNIAEDVIYLVGGEITRHRPTA